MTSDDKKALVVFTGSMFVALTYGVCVYLNGRKLKKQSRAFCAAGEEIIEELKAETAQLKAQNDRFDRRIAETEFKSPIPE